MEHRKMAREVSTELGPRIIWYVTYADDEVYYHPNGTMKPGKPVPPLKRWGWRVRYWLADRAINLMNLLFDLSHWLEVRAIDVSGLSEKLRGLD